jgi:hypothetical protein
MIGCEPAVSALGHLRARPKMPLGDSRLYREAVMPGHSRPEGRRASHAYVPGIHAFTDLQPRKGVDGRVKPGHDK